MIIPVFICSDDESNKDHDFVFVLLVDKNNNGINLFKKLNARNDMAATDEAESYVKNNFGYIHYKTLGFKRKKLYPFNVYMINKKYLAKYKNIEYDISAAKIKHIITIGEKII